VQKAVGQTQRKVWATFNSFDWTNEVLKTCKTIGYNLTSHQHDGLQSGRFNACHAEKQSMAFFAYRHRFTKEEWDEDEDIAKLADVHSSRRLQEATILASTPVCDDCEAFRAVFQRYARVTIDIQYLQTVS